jgi:hypothetical protein
MTYSVDGETVCVVVGAVMGKLVCEIGLAVLQSINI